MKTATAVMVAAAAGVAAVAAGVAAAANPVTGTIGGPVTSVQGQTFTLKSSLSPTGRSKVHVASTTTVTQQENATSADLRKGVCVFAVGQKNSKGTVQAMRLMLSAPVKGRCQAGFGRRPGGSPPRGAPRPGQGTPPRPPEGSGPRGGFANFGFAAGAIIGVSGSVLTVHGQQGSAKIAVSSKTQLVKTAHTGISAVKVGLCAFVTGASSDKGVNVSATSINLFKPGAQGCNGTFRRR